MVVKPQAPVVRIGNVRVDTPVPHSPDVGAVVRKAVADALGTFASSPSRADELKRGIAERVSRALTQGDAGRPGERPNLR